MNTAKHQPRTTAMPATLSRGSRRTLAAGACAGLLLAAAAPAPAFDIAPAPPPMYQGLILPLFPNGKTTPFSGDAGSGGAGRASAKPSSSAPASTRATGSPQVAANARELAQVAPVAQREQMAQAYLQSFDAWRQLERKLGLPADDVAGAVAAFIAGNYMAYRNEDVPDATYLRLVEQMRAALAGNRGFAAASPADKRRLYEQMAMVGTFMAVARLSFQQQPNPAAERNFRDAAAANLETALKVPAGQVRISERGLTLQ
jgi:hypothetical protein